MVKLCETHPANSHHPPTDNVSVSVCFKTLIMYWLNSKFQKNISLYIYWLVVWNIFYFSIYWEFHHPNWRTHIFQGGRYTTNQVIWDYVYPLFRLKVSHMCWFAPGFTKNNNNNNNNNKSIYIYTYINTLTMTLYIYIYMYYISNLSICICMYINECHKHSSHLGMVTTSIVGFTTLPSGKHLHNELENHHAMKMGKSTISMENHHC